MNTKMYLAYGSNMDLEQMAYRCPDARLVSLSEIVDYRMLFKGSKTGSYATIEPQKGKKVPVLVWQISERDERSLDRYEGFPVFYQKKNLTVEVGGKPVEAMAYLMDPSQRLGTPSKHYYDVLARAYEAFEFDLDILKEALLDSINLLEDPMALIC